MTEQELLKEVREYNACSLMVSSINGEEDASFSIRLRVYSDGDTSELKCEAIVKDYNKLGFYNKTAKETEILDIPEIADKVIFETSAVNPSYNKIIIHEKLSDILVKDSFSNSIKNDDIYIKFNKIEVDKNNKTFFVKDNALYKRVKVRKRQSLSEQRYSIEYDNNSLMTDSIEPELVDRIKLIGIQNKRYKEFTLLNNICTYEDTDLFGGGMGVRPRATLGGGMGMPTGFGGPPAFTGFNGGGHQENNVFNCIQIDKLKIDDINKFRYIRRTFNGLTQVRVIYLPADTKIISNREFRGLNELKKVIGLEDAEFIGSYAFRNCGFEQLKFGDNLMSLGEGAVSCCFHLEKIKLGKNIRTIQNYAFDNCPNLKDINLLELDKLEMIGYSAFRKSCNKDIREQLIELEKRGVKLIGGIDGVIGVNDLYDSYIKDSNENGFAF